MTGVTVPADELRRFTRDLFAAVGVPASSARLVGDTLVSASLRGVDSHGLQLVPFYVPQLEDGRLDARAEGFPVSESGAVMVYDGANGLGQVVADRAARHAVRLARAHGLGLVVARGSNHFGAAAWWAQQIASEGMIGIVLCNASSIVAPWQGRDTRWGTNPICMAVPGGAWLLDMATTTVAMGRIYKANLNEEAAIPAGWAMDRHGVATTSTAEALQGLLMPLGGYKGSGLAMMVEILCAVLSGGAMSTELGGLRVKDRPFAVSQFFLALDVARFMPEAEFRERVRKLVGMAKSSRPAPGYNEVLVAGEPEWRTEAVRSVEGVPVGEQLWSTLTQLAGRLGVALPETAAR